MNLIANHEQQDTALVYEDNDNENKDVEKDDFVQIDMDDNGDDDENAQLETQLTNTFDDNDENKEEEQAQDDTGRMTRNQTDTMPGQIGAMYSHPISISAEIPDVDNPTMEKYPSGSIKPMEDRGPSLIVVPKKSMDKAEDDTEPINKPKIVNYHQQAMDKSSNENYIV